MSGVLPIAQQGEPILKLIAAEVTEQEFGSQWLKQLLHALHETMLDQQGVGILHRKFTYLNVSLLWHHVQIYVIPMLR